MTDPTLGRTLAALIVKLVLAAMLVAPALAGARTATIFELSDPRGDDHGDGSLLYPFNDDYAPGDLDMVSFRARRGDHGTWFEAVFARPVRVPDERVIDALGTSLASAARFGFYTFNLDVYIDTDRQPGSGGIHALPGRKARIAPEAAWDRAILLTPRPHAARGELKRILLRTLEDELDQGRAELGEDQAETMRRRIPLDVEERVFFPTLVRVRGRTIEFFVPDSFLGGPAEATWSYVVAVSGANILQSFDLTGKLGLSEESDEALMILPLAEGRSTQYFGGRERAPLQPPLVDILVPHGAEQETVLRSYDPTERLPAELLGVVPAEQVPKQGAE
jgi:hypothetical protein